MAPLPTSRAGLGIAGLFLFVIVVTWATYALPPQFNGISYLVLIPILLSVAFAGPRVTGLLVIIAVGAMMFVSSDNGLFGDFAYWIRQVALLAVALIAVYLSWLVNSQRAHLHDQALNDALTGLPNRRSLSERLTELSQFRHHEMVALLVIDLDHFKHVNDAYTHFGGDRVLADVAHRLQGNVRAADTVARWGGDEFVVVCPEITGASDLEVLCERIITALSQPYPAAPDIPVSCTIGAIIVSQQDAIIDPEAVLQQADALLMRLKEHSRGNYTIHQI